MPVVTIGSKLTTCCNPLAGLRWLMCAFGACAIHESHWQSGYRPSPSSALFNVFKSEEGTKVPPKWSLACGTPSTLANLSQCLSPPSPSLQGTKLPVRAQAGLGAVLNTTRRLALAAAAAADVSQVCVRRWRHLGPCQQLQWGRGWRDARTTSSPGIPATVAIVGKPLRMLMAEVMAQLLYGTRVKPAFMANSSSSAPLTITEVDGNHHPTTSAAAVMVAVDGQG
jgi:hypothetical protein